MKTFLLAAMIFYSWAIATALQATTAAQATVTWDMGIIITVIVTNLFAFVTAALVRHDAKEKTKRLDAQDEKLETAAESLGHIKVLVNDQLTREKTDKLDEVRSHLASLERLMGKKPSDEDVSAARLLRERIASLEKEIAARDVAASTPTGAP